MALSGRHSEAILARCEWNGFTAPREAILGHACFLPRKGRSCVRRPWKSGSGIGESGCGGKLLADDRYLCGFGWLARAAWARTAVVIVFRFERAASTAPASASIAQPVNVMFLETRTNCASS